MTETTKDAKDQEVVRISNLGLASYLLGLGVSLIRLEWTSPDHADFLFQSVPNLDSLINGFYAGTGSIPALTYKSSLDLLKRRLWEERRDR